MQSNNTEQLKPTVGKGVGKGTNEIKRLASPHILKLFLLLCCSFHFNMTANSGKQFLLKALCEHRGSLRLAS